VTDHGILTQCDTSWVSDPELEPDPDRSLIRAAGSGSEFEIRIRIRVLKLHTIIWRKKNRVPMKTLQKCSFRLIFFIFFLMKTAIYF
jgi:hypothetical protein